MPTLRALLSRDGECLANLVQLFLMLRGFRMRAFLRDVRRFEWDVRRWLTERALARLTEAPIAPRLLIQNAPLHATARAQTAAPRSQTDMPVFRLLTPRTARPHLKSATPQPRAGLSKPFMPKRTLRALARRLDAARHALDHPEAAIQRLIARLRRRAADPADIVRRHKIARRLCALAHRRRGPASPTPHAIAQAHAPSLPPPDE